MVETDAIIRITETSTEWLGQGRLGSRRHPAIASCYRSRLAKASVAKFGERRTLVKGNVLGLAALDLVLRRFRARMVRVAVKIEISRMDVNDRAANAPGLGIPTHMIAGFELVFHDCPAQSFGRSRRRKAGFRVYHAPKGRLETGLF